VVVDPIWLGKVLDELVDNAVKYTPKGAAITLAATPSPDHERCVRISVRDAGPGFDTKDRDLLFTSFEQKDGSATRRVGGLGLGLSFVRRVAEDAGWTLSVHSVPGKGARVRAGRPAGEPPPPLHDAAQRPAASAPPQVAGYSSSVASSASRAPGRGRAR
jgi:signal transduction histidine kinase